MTTPNPGEGYRLLNGDEILQYGDEYYYQGIWTMTGLFGDTVDESGVAVFPYRRKLEAAHGRASGSN